MPNATITPVTITPGKTGWNVKDDKGDVYWLPPTDKFTQASNAPLYDELSAHIGEPIELAVWVKEDNSVRLIQGKPKPKGQGGGFKGGMTPEERIAERLSITSQTAAKCATDLMVAWVANDGPVDSDTWITWHQIILAAIREASAVQGPEQGSRVQAGGSSVGARHGTQGEPAAASLSGRAHETPAPATRSGEGSRVGEGAALSSEPIVQGSPAGNDGQHEQQPSTSQPPATGSPTESAPSPEPLFDRQGQLDRAATLYGSRAKVLIEARRRWPSKKIDGIEDVTSDQLVELVLAAIR